MELTRLYLKAEVFSKLASNPQTSSFNAGYVYGLHEAIEVVGMNTNDRSRLWAASEEFVKLSCPAGPGSSCIAGCSCEAQGLPVVESLGLAFLK